MEVSALRTQLTRHIWPCEFLDKHLQAATRQQAPLSLQCQKGSKNSLCFVPGKANTLYMTSFVMRRAATRWRQVHNGARALCHFSPSYPYGHRTPQTRLQTPTRRRH